MKAKTIYETINFERGKDPKQSMEIGLRKSLERKGIVFDTGWDQSGEVDRKVDENIKYVAEIVNLFLEAGLKPEDVRVSKHNHFYVKVYRVLEGNTVKHEVLSKKDGEMLIKFIQDLAIENHPRWKVSDDERDTKLVYGEEVKDWLKKIKENRKKYSKI